MLIRQFQEIRESQGDLGKGQGGRPASPLRDGSRPAAAGGLGGVDEAHDHEGRDARVQSLQRHPRILEAALLRVHGIQAGGRLQEMPGPRLRAARRHDEGGPHGQYVRRRRGRRPRREIRPSVGVPVLQGSRGQAEAVQGQVAADEGEGRGVQQIPAMARGL